MICVSDKQANLIWTLTQNHICVDKCDNQICFAKYVEI